MSELGEMVRISFCRVSLLSVLGIWFSWQGLKVTYLIPVYLELSECVKHQAGSLDPK